MAPLEPGVRINLNGELGHMTSLLTTANGERVDYKSLRLEHEAGSLPTLTVELYPGEIEVSAILASEKPPSEREKGLF